MIDRGRHSVLGIRVDAVDYDAAVDKILRAALNKQPLAVSALAVHGIMTGVLDRAHRHRLNCFDLIVPDGQPVRWALNSIHGCRLADRVYGPRLMLDVCRRAGEEGLPVFLFGGAESLLRDLSDRLRHLVPALQIAGCRASRFRQLTIAERDQLIQEIRGSGAGLVFVGLGCPRQEVFAYEMRNLLGIPLLAVGAAFNFHAGHLAQAPPAMQRLGLEWAFRLAVEPTRLWRRYLLLNPMYLTLLFMQAARLYSIDPESALSPSQEVRFG